MLILKLGSTYAWGWNGGGDSSSGSDSSGSSGYGTGSYGSSGSGFGQGSAGFSIPFGGDFEKAQRAMIAHGVLASLAFVIFFPFGAISIRLLSFPGLLWFHAVVQVIAYLLFIAAFGIGIYLATQIHRVCQRRKSICSLDPVLTSAARSSSSDHRYCAFHFDLLPAYPWLYASSSFQEVQAPHILVARSYLAWSHHHHSRHNQRRSWT